MPPISVVGNEQERRDEEELDEAERGVGDVQQAVEIGIDGGHQPEQQGQERAVDADGDLEDAVGADRIGEARSAPAEEKAAQPEPGHEGGEHGGDGVDGVAEDEPEQPEPDDFVDEARRPGEEEAGAQEAQHGSGRHRRHARRSIYLEGGLRPPSDGRRAPCGALLPASPEEGLRRRSRRSRVEGGLDGPLRASPRTRLRRRSRRSRVEGGLDGPLRASPRTRLRRRSRRSRVEGGLDGPLRASPRTRLRRRSRRSRVEGGLDGPLRASPRTRLRRRSRRSNAERSWAAPPSREPRYLHTLGAGARTRNDPAPGRDCDIFTRSEPALNAERSRAGPGTAISSHARSRRSNADSSARAGRGARSTMPWRRPFGRASWSGRGRRRRTRRRRRGSGE